jgi:hypothetical protein
MSDVGVWVGFLFSLILFSTIAGDHALARLAQHVLVGAALGYAALLTVREVLQPRLFQLWLSGAADGTWLWVPLLLGLFLLAAGADYVLAQGNTTPGPLPGWRRGMRSLALLPIGLMLGVSIGVAIMGVVQGTVLPQAWRAISATPDPEQPLPNGLTQALTLLLTTATLLHLTVNRQLPWARQPLIVQRLFTGWVWIGKRALWIAAGVIFARLAAARLSLLISWLESVYARLEQMGILDWVANLWQSL